MINVDTTGLDLSSSDDVAYRRIFERIAQEGKGAEPLRGNIIISFDGHGIITRFKVERWVSDLSSSIPTL